jgi:cytochrome c peroxidase
VDAGGAETEERTMIRIFAGTIVAFAAAVCLSAQGGTDEELRNIIRDKQLRGDPILSRKLPIPPMDDPMVVLGKALFWTKAIGSDREVACVTCHHPFMGFGDNLPITAGVDAEFPDRIGPGRKRKRTDAGQIPIFGNGNAPMPRNSPTLIGLAFWDKSITWDGTVFSETGTPGMSGTDGRIIAPVDTPPVQGMFTHPFLPRSDFLTYEEKWDAGMPISSGHGLLPAAVNAAMRGRAFGAKTAPTMSTQTDLEVRQAIAAVIGNYGGSPPLSPLPKNDWVPLFRRAFNDPSGPVDRLVTPNKISVSIAAYERTMTFTETPWKAYVQGNNSAISDSAKRGAALFYKPIASGGANCGSCHSGDFFTDEEYWVIAVPQMGRGKTDVNIFPAHNSNDDWGRAHVTGKRADKYAYRTQTLLGIEMTGPWGHDGVFNTLKEVVKHHLNARESVENFDWTKVSTEGGPLNLAHSEENSKSALDQLLRHRRRNKPGVLQDANLNDSQVDDIVEFLKTLTDPCLKDQACLAKWIPGPSDPDPDGLRICAKDGTGKELWAPSCEPSRYTER